MVLDPLVFILVLAAAVMHAGWNATVKASGDQLMRTAIIMATPGLISVVAIFFLPPLDWSAAGRWLALSIAIHCVYYVMLLGALRHGDLSQVYPLARGSAPALVAIGAWFFAGEGKSWVEVGALVVLSCGLMALAFRTPGQIRRQGEQRAVLYALGTGLTIAAYSLSDGLGVRASGNAFTYIAWLFALEPLPLLAFVLWRRRGRLRESAKGNVVVGIGGGLVAGGAYGIVMWAMSVAPLAHVVALRETSVLFAALIGTHILAEPFGRRRMAAAAIIVLGAMALQLSKGL